MAAVRRPQDVDENGGRQRLRAPAGTRPAMRCRRHRRAWHRRAHPAHGTVHVEIAPRARRRRRGTEATRTAAAATARRAVVHEQRRARQARSHANRLETASAVQQREPETREAVRAFHAGDKRRRAEVDAEARRETPSSGSEARSKEPRINDAARRARRLAQILLARGECEAQARASRALRRGSSACLRARQEAFRIRCAPAPTRKSGQAGPRGGQGVRGQKSNRARDLMLAAAEAVRRDVQ